MSTGFEADTNQTDAFDVDFGGVQSASDIQVADREPIESGAYHVGVKEVVLAPLDKNHKPIKDGFAKLELEVFGGEPAKEIGRTFSVVFQRPDSSATGDEKRWKHDDRLAILQRLVLVTGLAQASAAGQRVKPQWDRMIGRHFVVKVKRGKPSGEYKIGILNVVNVWHSASAEMAKYVDASISQEYPMGPDPLPANAGQAQTGTQATPAVAQQSQQAAATTSSAVEAL